MQGKGLPGRAAAALAALLALALPAPAAARPGTLDRGFGADGRVALDAAGAFVARAVAVDGRDRIVVAGYLCQPDPQTRDGTCLTDGDTSFRLARLTPDGGLDAEFGAGGFVTTALGDGRAQALDLVLLGDGSIVAGGVARRGGRDVFALARYREDGGLDDGFGDGGAVLAPVGAGHASIADVEPGPRGTLLAAGQAVDGGGVPRIAVGRFDAEGALDAGYGDGGATLAGAGGFGYGLGLAAAPNGSALVGGLAGDTADPATYRVAALRVERDGRPERRFGDAGFVEHPVGASSSFANAVAFAPGGWLAAGAATDRRGRQAMAAVRGRRDGGLDPRYGRDGSVLVSLGDGAVANDLVPERGGRALLVGQAAEGGGYGFATVGLDRRGTVRHATVVGFPGYPIARATAGALQGDRLVSVGIGCVGGAGARCTGGTARLLVARQHTRAAPDRSAPRIRLGAPPRRVRAHRLAGMRVRVRLSEPARLRASLVGRRRGDGRRVVLWRLTVRRPLRAASMRLRPSRRALRAVRPRLRLEIRARDAAGNTALRAAPLTLRRERPRAGHPAPPVWVACAPMPRRTKIVATIGPASRDPEVLVRMIEAGLDVARLNFSHGSAETHAETAQRVRDAAGRAGRNVALLQDLPGPKLRIGRLADDVVELKPGDEVTFRCGGEDPGDGTAERMFIGWGGLAHAIDHGEVLYLADGAVRLRTVRVRAEEGEFDAHVEIGGAVATRQGVNLPGEVEQLPALPDEDLGHLQTGERIGVDMVALSFVRRAEEVDALREHTRLPLIAKIEKPQAVERIEEITHAADCLMVARGDLGIELRIEEVPLVQKRVIACAGSMARPVITATQMLDSMVASTRPTRAEVADVANAILDGTDAVMLSQETAVGAYPVEAVRMMASIAERAEQAAPYDRWNEWRVNRDARDPAYTVAFMACRAANELGLAALVVPTLSGRSVRLISAHRPTVPIYALSPGRETVRRCGLMWGVTASSLPRYEITEQLIAAAARRVVELGWVRRGERVGITAGLPSGRPGTTSLFQVQEV